MKTHQDKVARQYDVWSKVYDHTFKPLLDERMRRAIDELRLRPGDRVLDLGIGTGLTLSHYPSDVDVVGIDISEGMLEQADRKVRRGGLRNVTLVQADGLALPFADQSFDHILSTHVISVVPDPVRMLEEAERVLRPGGRVVMANHFKSEKKSLGALMKFVNPVCMKLGWRSDLDLDSLVEPSPLRIVQRYKLKKIDLWSIVVMRRARELAVEPTVGSGRPAGVGTG